MSSTQPPPPADRPRQVLRQLAAERGVEILTDARRLKGLLTDLCGAHRREIAALTSAAELRLADSLQAAPARQLDLVCPRLALRLQNESGLEATLAAWAVASFAAALGSTWSPPGPPESQSSSISIAKESPLGGRDPSALPRLPPGNGAEAENSELTVYCKSCGRVSRPLAAYCAGCGQVLTDDQVSRQPPGRLASSMPRAMLATLAFPPIGLAAILHAIEVRERIRAHDYEGAREAARNAAFWGSVALFLGLILWIFLIVTVSF